LADFCWALPQRTAVRCFSGTNAQVSRIRYSKQLDPISSPIQPGLILYTVSVCSSAWAEKNAKMNVDISKYANHMI
jgi:hypothetical protein